METSFYKKPMTCHLAIHLILSAAWKDHEQIIGGKKVLIRRGQIPSGRNKLAMETGLSPQNIRTSLQHLVKVGFLTIESTNVCSIITICKYGEYQSYKEHCQPTYQPTINQPSTNHQPLQNKGYKEINNIPYRDIVAHLNEKSGKQFKNTTKATRSAIRARWNEGFRFDDFKRVIDNKCDKWASDEKMVDYLRPQTLFSTKFEAYLNECPPVEKKQRSVFVG